MAIAGRRSTTTIAHLLSEGMTASAAGINDLGQIVGSSGGRAALWNPT